MSTITAYGITAAILQGAAYNHAIAVTFDYFGRAAVIFRKYDRQRIGKLSPKDLISALCDTKVSMKSQSKGCITRFDFFRP